MQTVEVTDSGPGISPELRGRIFEPFFTTREVGEGTGLGLSISHGIASSHGGALALVDSPSGARFRLTLPAHADAAALPRSVPGAGVRALVVDDDAPIRKLIVRLLEKRGYEVSEAETGESAMALALDRRPGIVICDTGVPRDDGLRSLSPAGGARTPRARRDFSSSAATRPPCRRDSDVAGIPGPVQALHRNRPRDGARRGGNRGAAGLIAVAVRAWPLLVPVSFALMSCLSCGCTLYPAFSADFTASSASL